MESPVFALFGTSVTIGIVVSVLTNIVKFTQKVPYLSSLPFVQKLIDIIDRGNAAQIRTFVALLCLAANTAYLYSISGTVPAIPMMVASFNSFLTALGTYDFALRAVSNETSDK